MAEPTRRQRLMMPPTERVFVYGSLRRGQANHRQLLGARHEGEGTLEGADLHDLGPFPMAVPGSGRVQGEVFAVTRELLLALDRFEGVPRLYKRRRRRLADGRRVWVYLGRAHQVRHSPLLAEGRWQGPRRRPVTRGLPEGMGVLAISVLALTLQGQAPAAAGGFDNQAACSAWRSSHGSARILLGNQIGAENYLSKSRRFQESPPEQPVALYSVIDLQRVCSERR
ncbi:gamma-glutamylcyclotransferase [Cyanobium sp. FGCU-6]|nr:gamma-glutamylcyclotransferase [Cyanobium sp. FGCU6]